ncbi:HNH endonuclease [Actinacidiphila alni]|uniref:HNH endonuclease n=1 Tax=Actinacidiphila alni TaxID=380248 RepID=UPI0034511D8B
MAAAERPDSARLRQAVAASISVAESLRRLGLPCTSRHRVLMRQWIAEEAISIAHFLGQGHLRGRPSATPRKEAAEILVKHGRSRRTKTAHLRRALHEIGVPDMCAECGTGPVWQGRPMTLEVDHVNGDWQDDRPGNLRLLCPNCHAVTATWCRGGRRR